jgi:hypothetical protein
MTKHAEAIIEKMKSSVYPELNFEFAFKLTNESERGAILVGSSKVETYLENLILSVLPSKEKSFTSKLFNYPGPLSSFSGKIELSYAFNVIDKRVYDSLTTLKKLRNNAAHTDEEFLLSKRKDELEKIYDFEDGFPYAIHKQSFDHLIKWKKDIFKNNLIKENLSEKVDYEKVWNEHIPDPGKNESIQEQLVIWKLAYGLTLLCLKIEIIREEHKSSPSPSSAQ